MVLSFGADGAHQVHEVTQNGCHEPPGVRADRFDPLQNYAAKAFFFEFDKQEANFTPKEQY